MSGWMLGQAFGLPVLIAVILFAAAGRVDLPFYWAYVAIMAALSVGGLFLISEDLARERMRPGGKRPPWSLRLAFLACVLPWAIAGVDRGRFHWSNVVPLPLRLAALIAFVMGLALTLWAMHANRFFSSAVRIQRERGQRVVADGPYRWIRHPGYAGAIPALSASGLVPCSWLATALGALGASGSCGGRLSRTGCCGPNCPATRSTPKRSGFDCCRVFGKRNPARCLLTVAWQDCEEDRKEGREMALANERVAWFNGKILRESEVLIPFRDQGFTRGDGVFDMTRSFNGKPFRLEEHVARLYRSLKYLDLDPGLSPAEMVAISTDVLDRNRHLLGAGEDYWLAQRVSRGIHPVVGDNWEHYGPNVIVECIPLPLRERAALFRDGIAVVTPSVRRTPPDALSPRAKMHQYLNLVLADREVKAQDPEAWAVLLDAHGNLAEGLGSNIFLIRDGGLLTPRERYVLPGVSRQAVIDLAGGFGIPCAEADLDLYDAYTAEECFLTSTSLCICGVKSLNGRGFAAGTTPGPVTRRLIEAYKEMVGCDFVAQYLGHLDG